MLNMRRRQFITLVGGAAVAWPLAARAAVGDAGDRVPQQRSPGSHCGIHTGARENIQGLGKTGWSIGRNVQIDQRWGAGDAERTRHTRRKSLRCEVAAIESGRGLTQPSQPGNNRPRYQELHLVIHR